MKRGLEINQHVELGKKIKQVHKDLYTIWEEIMEGYTKKSYPVKWVTKAIQNIDELKNQLDSAVCSEHRDSKFDTTKCYYGEIE